MATYTFYPTYNKLWNGGQTYWEDLRVSGDSSPTWTDGVKSGYELSPFAKLYETYFWFATDTLPDAFSCDGSATFALCATSSVHNEDGDIQFRYYGANIPVTQRFVGSGSVDGYPLCAALAVTGFTIETRVNMTSAAAFLTAFSTTHSSCYLLIPDHIHHRSGDDFMS